MDPLSQGLLGAAAAQAVFSRPLGRWATPIGLLAGMAADVDVLFNWGESPLANLLLHRHFTHALLFIPLGGLLCALPFWWIPRLRLRRKAVLGAALLAYATHGLLDACTAYGTALFWPFSSAWVGWDLIAIIDPIFTGMLLLGVLVGVIVSNVKPARCALLGAGLYLALGIAQHQRALAAQNLLAGYRFDEIEHQRVMPTLGNLVVWRSVYQSHGWIKVDSIRVPLLGGMVTVREGERLRRQDLSKRADALGATLQARDLRRFEAFADGFTAPVNRDPNRIGDLRYSRDAASSAPLWLIVVDPDQPQAPAAIERFVSGRGREMLRALWAEIQAPHPDAQPLHELDPDRMNAP